MSLSDPVPKFRGGRVIMGLQTRNLDEVNAQARNLVRMDTPETEARFLEKVREKARTAASEIISKAMVEAREIRLKAYEEGRNEGLSQAAGEILAKKEELSSSISKIFLNLNAEKQKLWNDYRQDIIFVLMTSIDKILGMEVSKNRIEIMQSLLDQSLELVDRSRELNITVSRDDEQIVKEMLERAREIHPELLNYRIRPSSTVKKGGLILENGTGVVDNTLDSRYRQVKEIVEQLTLTEEDS